MAYLGGAEGAPAAQEESEAKQGRLVAEAEAFLAKNKERKSKLAAAKNTVPHDEL